MKKTKQVHTHPLRVETLEKDLLGRESYIRSLESYLSIEHEFTEGSLVVSLHAKFGSGKSTLLKMWENDLLKRRSESEDVPLVINLNAWNSDFYGEPLIPIIMELVDAILKHMPKEEGAEERLKEVAKDAAWFMLGLFNRLGSFDIPTAVDLAEKKKLEREEEDAVARPDLLNDYKSRKCTIKRLKNLLNEILGDDKPKAFVFVDELDRCRPDYAVSYLETIKHIFDIHGIVFVLAIDYDHLANSARALYGDRLEFSEYFRKFVHRSFEMAEPKPDNIKKFVGALTDYYLHNNKSRFIESISFHKLELPNLMETTEMLPRQSIEFFRLLGHLVGVKEQSKMSFDLGFNIGIVLMCVFKVVKKEIYHALGKGEGRHNEVLSILTNKMSQESARWWFAVYLGGFYNKINAYKFLKSHDLLNDDNRPEQTVNEETRILAARIWFDGMNDDKYPMIYKLIEAIERLED